MYWGTVGAMEVQSGAVGPRGMYAITDTRDMRTEGEGVGAAGRPGERRCNK